jgi:hypothetical protein
LQGYCAVGIERYHRPRSWFYRPLPTDSDRLSTA